MRRPNSTASDLVRRDLLAIGFASSLFVLHALVFGSWIVDDAGISFSYARNLASGHGLVSQPGREPLEGYSNPLWVLVMAVFAALGSFHPVLTPKIVAIVLTIATFAVIYVTVATLSDGRRSVAFVALVCLALNTGFVLWAVSGLENSLYVLLLSAMLALAVVPTQRSAREPVWYALLAICVALTRPDGAAYAGVYPLIRSVRGMTLAESPRKIARDVFTYGGLIASIGGILLSLRFFYFHDLLPNTYYAKGGPTVRGFLIPGHLVSLVEAVTGCAGSVWLLLVGLATAILVRRRRMGWPHLTSLVFLCLSLLIFVTLPPDWMGGFRFGSPFIVFFVTHALVTLRLSLAALDPSTQRQERAWYGVGAAVIAGSLILNHGSSRRFANEPPIPFSAITQRTQWFDEYARTLGVERGSFLTPDVGGALYFSRLQIFDLGMLCDRTIARTLGKNPPAFYDYVFEVVKPTFIHTHDLWTALANFDDDKRFRRDYVAIREWTGDAWVFEGSRTRMLYSGDFVRRDALPNPQPIDSSPHG